MVAFLSASLWACSRWLICSHAAKMQPGPLCGRLGFWHVGVIVIRIFFFLMEHKPQWNTNGGPSVHFFQMWLWASKIVFFFLQRNKKLCFYVSSWTSFDETHTVSRQFEKTLQEFFKIVIGKKWEFLKVKMVNFMLVLKYIATILCKSLALTHVSNLS